MQLLVFPLLIFSFFGCKTGAVTEGSVLESKTVAPAATSTPNAKPDGDIRITIAAVGDMMIGSPYPRGDRMPPEDGKDMFKLVEPVLSKADIAFGNLEGPMADSGSSAKCRPGSTACYAFRMPTRYAKYFKEAGFDVLNTANNHAGDFGETGRASTRAALEGVGIKHAGSNSGQFSTAYVEAQGKKIAFIGFATNNVSLNINDLPAAAAAVRQADKKADIVVVSFHGGAEGTDNQHVRNKTEIFYGEARGNLPLFARTVIDAGADLVIGHGPHVLRGMEIYKDRLIAYSLGNFATYGWFKLIAETRLTAILEAEIDGEGKLVGGKIHSGKQIDWGVPALDLSGEALRKIRSLSDTDFGANALKFDDKGDFLLK
ncbi:MAG: CapA family protein [Pyrinomonadaceae bacterium]